MFYRNEVKTRKSRDFVVKFDTFEGNSQVDYDDKKQQIQSPQTYYNFKNSNGYLEDCYGIRDLHLPTTYGGSTEVKTTIPSTELKSLWGFHWYNSQLDRVNVFVFYLDENDNLYYMEEVDRFDMFNNLNVTFSSMPTAFQYEVYNGDVMVFTSRTDGVIVVTGSSSVITYQDAVKLSSCCFHENCLYGVLGTDDNTLVYSKNLNVLNWEENDINQFKFYDDGGKLNKVISFNDYVYLFRDKAIVKIYPYSVNADLSITTMYNSSSFIFPKTIKTCGEVILFLTRDGIYSFNGSLVSKLNIRIAEKIKYDKTQKMVATFYKGKYFLACHVDFEDNNAIGCESSLGGYDNNAVIIYDIATKNVEVMRGVDIRDFTTMESNYMDKLLCIFNGDNKGKIGEFTLDGNVFGVTMQKKWTSKSSDFGYKGKTKIIKFVNITAKQDCQLVIKSDKETKILSVKGSSNSQRIRANVRGESFELSIVSSQANQKIKAPEFEVTVLL